MPWPRIFPAVWSLLNCFAELPKFPNIGKKDGWTVVLGGNLGDKQRIAEEVTAGLDDSQVLQAVDRLVHCYEANAKKGERLGKTIDRIGLEPFQAAIRDAKEEHDD